MRSTIGGKGDLACSFCKKNQTEVRLLVVAEGANICDECVENARWIVWEKGRSDFVRNILKGLDLSDRGLSYLLLQLVLPSIFLAWRAASVLDESLGLGAYVVAPWFIVTWTLVFLSLSVGFLVLHGGLGQSALRQLATSVPWVICGILAGQPLGPRWMIGGALLALLISRLAAILQPRGKLRESNRV
jgi:hypothetical protein